MSVGKYNLIDHQQCTLHQIVKQMFSNGPKVNSVKLNFNSIEMEMPMILSAMATHLKLLT